MRKTAVAEWILSLVTTREWAAATVGDCLEDTSGSFAFWWFVLRTMLSLCWRDVREARWRLLGLGICGLVTEAFLFAVIWGFGMLLWIAIVSDFWGFDAVDKPAAGVTAVLLAVFVGHVMNPFLAGRMVAQLSGGREFAAGVVLVLVHAVFIVVHVCFDWSGALVLSTNEMWVAAPLFAMAGALSWRARHPRAA